MQPTELFAIEQTYWNKQNIKLFGVELLDETTPFSHLQKQLDECCAKYWNVENPCIIAVNINNGLLDHDYTKKVDNTFRLELNPFNMCIDVFAMYDVNGKQSEYKICALPTPSVDLCWIINKSHYVPRVTAVRDYFSLIGKVAFDTIKGEGWTYNIADDLFVCNAVKNPFEPTVHEIFTNHLSKRSRALLQSCMDEPLTEDNFTQALRLMPVFEPNSVFNYKFSRIEYFEDIVLHGGKYAQPTKKILLGINQMYASQAKQFSNSGERLEGCLIRSESKIFALENFRTVTNIYNGDYKPAFTYTDTVGFFDSFKTVTSGSAGRQRLLLDNVIVKDGMMWVRDDKTGIEKNMFEVMYEPQAARISCLSHAPFCNNDKPKRIMMNAKLTSQSVSLAEETNPLTHLINARVGFTDLEGYTYADSIIISESFAKRLRTFSEDILYFDENDDIYKEVYDAFQHGKKVDFELLKLLYPRTNDAILDSYENVVIKKIDMMTYGTARVFISWEIPFRLGDKITNRHGAKGTVGKIIPDSKMPQLMKRVGNMTPGPLEVIISGFSTMRRGSLGQIFEAWANASGIQLTDDSDFIAKMIDRYQKQMQEYAKNSIVKYNGERAIIPVGIITMMRVYHHASIHISQSAVDSDYNKTLKLGEMEKLNLVAAGCTSILQELSIRSVHKYVGASKMIHDMEESRELPENPILSLKLASIFKSMGYDIRLDGKSLIKSDLSNVEFDETDIANFNNLSANI